MKYYLFPNPKKNPWIEKYNSLVSDIKEGKRIFTEEDLQRGSEIKIGSRNVCGLGKHHVIPKSLRPDLVKDPANIVELPFKEHMDLHYFLWKADNKYGRQLWFGCVFGRKHGLWDLPGGEEEYEELKKCLRKVSKPKEVCYN